MTELVTAEDMARARSDAAFRQQLLTDNLNRLLAALNRMREAGEASPAAIRQIREGADLAVKLADRLQATAHSRGPEAA
jgi:hypothetical protein